MALLDIFDFSSIYERVIKFLGPVGKVISLSVESFKRLGTVVKRMTELLDEAVDEFKEWKNFKQDARIKSRVINLEVAIKKTTALIQGIPDSWHAILDLVSTFKENLGQVDSKAEAEEILAETEEGTGEALTKILQRLPKLAKGLTRLAAILGLVLQALDSLSKTIDDLKTILDELRRLRLEIEKLDTIFLSQGNKRKRLKLEDGRTINFRVGKLHSAGL